MLLTRTPDFSSEKARVIKAGADFVVGNQRNYGLSFPEGGPLALNRGEAAGLDCLLDRVETDKPLLVFTECLVLLTILLSWSRIDV